MRAHTPSEHTIDGLPAAAEFHFVHENADGALLVVGVLAEVGEQNAQWQPFIDLAAGDAKSETAMVLSGSAQTPGTRPGSKPQHVLAVADTVAQDLVGSRVDDISQDLDAGFIARNARVASASRPG
ncbi:hypothetical protein [Microbacterium sp. NPDC055665]